MEEKIQSTGRAEDAGERPPISKPLVARSSVTDGTPHISTQFLGSPEQLQQYAGETSPWVGATSSRAPGRAEGRAPRSGWSASVPAWLLLAVAVGVIPVFWSLVLRPPTMPPPLLPVTSYALALRSTEPPAGGTTSSLTPAPMPPLLVDVSVQPPRATLTLDGERVAVGRLVAELPADNRLHELRIRASGYVPKDLLFRTTQPPSQVTLQPNTSTVLAAAAPGSDGSGTAAATPRATGQTTARGPVVRLIEDGPEPVAAPQ